MSISYVTSTLGLFVITYFLSKLIQRFITDWKLPAGPWGIPIFGYMPFLTSRPYVKLIELSKKYGKIFSVGVGMRSVVFVNDWESIKAVLSNDELLGRPELTLFTSIFPIEPSFADMSGQTWKDERRVAFRVFRDLGFGKDTMENNIKSEIHYMLEKIDDNLNKNIDICKYLTPSVSNNILYLVSGTRLDFEHKDRVMVDQVLDVLSDFLTIISNLQFSQEFLPFCYEFSRYTKYNLRDKLAGFQKYIQSVVDEQYKKYDGSGSFNDYIEGYIIEMKKLAEKERKNADSFTMTRLYANTFAFIGTGSETVRTSLLWIYKMLAERPDYQKRIQAEIDEVVGRERMPSRTDRAFMPHTMAFIQEIQRWVSIVPINLARRAMSDTHINGVFIPKDTAVFCNFYSVHYDENIYENPREFNPDRFIESDGKTLKKLDAFLAFSMGKRSCVGETLAKFQLFFYTAVIMQKYNIRTADTGKRTTFAREFGFTIRPKQFPILIFEKR